MGDYKVLIKEDVLRKLKAEALVCLEQTAEAVHTDLVQSQTMPFDKGVLQGDSTFVMASGSNNGEVKIVTDTPYARRLYYHPEYNFNKDSNPDASGAWLETYLNGEKKEFAGNTFKKLYKSRTGV